MSIGLDHLQAVSTLAGDDKDRHIYGTKLDTGSCCYSNSSLPLNHIKDLNNDGHLDDVVVIRVNCCIYIA